MYAEDFVELLERVPEKLASASYREALEQTSYEVAERMGENYVRQEDSSGNPWPPHAPLTVKLHGVHPLLKLSHAMYAATINPDDPNAKKTLGDREVVFGVDGNELPYATKQNEGAGRIPRREFFYLRSDAVDGVVDKFASLAGVVVEDVFSR